MPARKIQLLFSFLAAVPLIAGSALAGEVNVNTASAETIADELKGVGKTKADAIVAYRKQHGAFARVEDLLRVQGVGPRILEDNAGDIRLTTPEDE